MKYYTYHLCLISQDYLEYKNSLTYNKNPIHHAMQTKLRILINKIQIIKGNPNFTFDDAEDRIMVAALWDVLRRYFTK